ncbi:MAG: histidinol-phosphatase HisJ family protein [Anaerolineae bacterium]|nr:histidinol-phosphatase HisJ family protein [Thermoflexales bacterium]MDW8406901.1 histidinol-phosphatase HisJ family protein [Anaerolineae bacterium]
MLIDYHVHTHFSCDCNYSMEDMCRAAIAAGAHQIAFCEHEEHNPSDGCYHTLDHDAYWRELRRCRALFAGQLTIRAGIEISEPHRYADQAAATLAAYPWDYVLGSLHWLDEQTNTLSPHFADRFGPGRWRESFRAYFREIQRLAQEGEFDIIAHFDYPARYFRPPGGDTYHIAEFEAEIRPALQTLIARGKGIEINTASLRKGLSHPCPPSVVVGWYREMGGRILTIGSDAHRPQDVTAGFAVAAQIARAAGFTQLAVFEHRRPDFIDLMPAQP